MTTTITVRHNAEMGHRLPTLPGKCQSLHGHSWWFEVEIEAPIDPATGIAGLEFGTAKGALRDWIDTNLDHGLCLGRDDDLLPILREHGKVTEFPQGGWPTVEGMAWWVAQIMDTWLLAHTVGARVIRCTVTETHVNAATWTAYRHGGGFL